MPASTLPPDVPYTDESTPEEFVFRFSCERCGRELDRERYDFSAGEVPDGCAPYIRELLWNRRHKEALLRARFEAQYFFNRCPVCKRYVCTPCYMLAEDGQGRCPDCLTK